MAQVTGTLIIANGRLPRQSILRPLLKTARGIICADGGANRARKIGIRPDIILGDFDSITAATQKYFNGIPQVRLCDQDSTDLEKAILYCIGLNRKRATVIGASGDRIDHVTGALGCFRKFGGLIGLRFVLDHGEILPAGKSITIRTTPGLKISLIPIGKCTGITTTNLRYPLRHESLEIGVREGISNEATGKTATIRSATGTLLVYIVR